MAQAKLHKIPKYRTYFPELRQSWELRNVAEAFRVRVLLQTWELDAFWDSKFRILVCRACGSNLSISLSRFVDNHSR